MAKTDQLEAAINELLAWKRAQEQDQADRLTEMHNALLDIFVARHATISEIHTVLEMLKLEAITNFINAKRTEQRALASQQVPPTPTPKTPTEIQPASTTSASTTSASTT